MDFTWDDRKNRTNQRKHGVSFEAACLVFDDPFHISLQDREVDGEPRWQTIGRTAGLYILTVAHTIEEEEDEAVRIISARKATREERRIYEEQL